MKRPCYGHGGSVLLIRKVLYNVLLSEEQNSKQWNDLNYVTIRNCVYVSL